MKVGLMAWTQHAEFICYLASKTCRSNDGPMKMLHEYFDDSYDVEEHLRARIKEGHLSILEHCAFTFGIEGISRICSHQLVRHRIGCSYSQQSQRHTTPDTFMIPPSVAMIKNSHKSIQTYIENISDFYDYLVDQGIEMEDARYFLPGASVTNIVVTMNGRSLRHFFDLRLKHPAQWEIRELANRMLSEVKRIAPVMFEDYEVELYEN